MMAAKKTPAKARSTTKAMTVKVGHFKVSVTAASPATAEAHEFLGVFMPATSKIEIDTTRPPEVQGEALIHEILHAVWHDRAIPGDETAEEYVVTNMARGISALIVDNPGLFEMLRSTLVNGKPLPL